eukprot:5227364-Pyramimonas_sp.AAC.1
MPGVCCKRRFVAPNELHDASHFALLANDLVGVELGAVQAQLLDVVGVPKEPPDDGAAGAALLSARGRLVAETPAG